MNNFESAKIILESVNLVYMLRKRQHMETMIYYNCFWKEEWWFYKKELKALDYVLPS